MGPTSGYIAYLFLNILTLRFCSSSQAVLEFSGFHNPAIILLLKLTGKFLSFFFPQKGQMSSSGNICCVLFHSCHTGSLQCLQEPQLEEPEPAVLSNSSSSCCTLIFPWTSTGQEHTVDLGEHLDHDSISLNSPSGTFLYFTLGTSCGLGTFIRSQRQLRFSLTTGNSASLQEELFSS